MMWIFVKKRLRWYFTIPLIVIGALLAMGSQAYIGLLSIPDCGIGDRLQSWTAPINRYFFEHTTAANGVLITTSLWFDFSCLFLMARTIFGKSIRPYLGLFLFIALRQSFQFLVSLPIPEGIIWHYPLFPSLFVLYDIANDFYFSAHTGISLLCAIELSHLGKKWLTSLGFVLFSYMVATVICFRIHYTMDVFTAVLAVFLVNHLAKKWAPPVDAFFRRHTI